MDGGALGRVREILVASGYDETGFASTLGLAPPLTLRPGDEHRLGRRIDRSRTLDALIALLFLGESWPVSAAVSNLGEATVDALRAAGLLTGGDGVRARHVVVPDGNALVCSDPPEPSAPDQVTGPDNAARLLTRLTPRSNVGAALDLGSGNGIQALHLAEHAQRVVATDANPRAAEMTRCSAALSAVANVEVRVGDWLDPVADGTFDLVVCNPPFVISPDNELDYRDAPDSRALLARLLPDIAAVLGEQGVAVVLANWVVDDEGWATSPRAWVEQCGCTALVLRMAAETAAAYAERWCEPYRLRDPRRYASTLDRWIDWYEDRKITRIASGAIVLRATAGRSRARILDAPDGVPGEAGGHVIRVLDDIDRPIDDADLPETVFAPVDGLEIVRRDVQSGHWSSADPVLVSTSGLGVRHVIAEPLDRFVRALDGQRTTLEAASMAGSEPWIERAALLLARDLATSGLVARRS